MSSHLICMLKYQILSSNSQDAGTMLQFSISLEAAPKGKQGSLSHNHLSDIMPELFLREKLSARCKHTGKMQAYREEGGQRTVSRHSLWHHPSRGIHVRALRKHWLGQPVQPAALWRIGGLGRGGRETHAPPLLMAGRHTACVLRDGWKGRTVRMSTSKV